MESRDHAGRRLEPGQQDRQLADRARPVRRPAAALQPACPAGENIQAWLYEAEEGGEGYERAWRKLVEDNPFPAIMGRVCYHPARPSATALSWTSRWGSTPVERFVGDEAIEQRWSFDPPTESSGKRVLIVGAGPRAYPPPT